MNKFDKERRRQTRLERFGANKPICMCGETDDRVFEAHHVAGQHFDQAIVLICRNCHRKASDDQRDHPKPSSSQPPLMEIVAHALLGMADLFAVMIEMCRKFAQQIFDTIARDAADQGGQNVEKL